MFNYLFSVSAFNPKEMEWNPIKRNENKILILSFGHLFLKICGKKNRRENLNFSRYHSTFRTQSKFLINFINMILKSLKKNYLFIM